MLVDTGRGIIHVYVPLLRWNLENQENNFKEVERSISNQLKRIHDAQLKVDLYA